MAKGLPSKRPLSKRLQEKPLSSPRDGLLPGSETSGVRGLDSPLKGHSQWAKIGEKEPFCVQGWGVRVCLGGGTTFRRPTPLPQLPPLAAGAVLRGKEAFPVSPPPNFPAFLASPEKRQQAQGGGWAATLLSPQDLEMGGKEDMEPRKGRRGDKGSPCV